MRNVVAETGVLKGRTRRALDSTLLDDAVATQDTVTQLVAQIRRVRHVVPTLNSIDLIAHDYDQPGKPLIAWDDAKARATLIDALVVDALSLLEGAPEVGLDDDQENALALVAGQDVELDERGQWRIVQGVAKHRVISVVDPESRHMHKSRSAYRDGYKAHLCVEPETGLVTAATLTPANTPDGATGVQLLSGEEPGLSVLADGAYGSGETLAALESAGHLKMIKPYPLSRAVAGGFTRDDFVVDYEARSATCPAGHRVTLTSGDNAVFGSRCRDCAFRACCTTAQSGKTLSITPYDRERVESRRAWREGDFIFGLSKTSAVVERSIAWLVKDHYRRVRFRGVERNQLGLSMRVAAINLRRLISLGLTREETWIIASG